MIQSHGSGPGGLLRRGAAALWVCLLALVVDSSAVAQHVPERTPRPGEERFNQFRYVSTHNSYQLGSSLSEQLDRFNVTQIELDLRWDSLNDRFWIQHSCFDQTGENSLDALLSEIRNTEAFKDRFIWLDFDSAPLADAIGCSCDLVISPFTKSVTCIDGWEQRLSTRVADYFQGRIYTPADFTADQEQFPSLQEFMRRNKRILITSGAGSWGFPGARVFSRDRLIANNTKDQNLVYFFSIKNGETKTTVRWYPPDRIWCYEDRYNTALIHGFTFAASNCPEDAKVDNPNLHPPNPMYLSGGENHVADKYFGTGTFNNKLGWGNALLRALDRVEQHEVASQRKSRIEIRMSPGNVPYRSRSRIDMAVRLTAPNGGVRLKP